MIHASGANARFGVRHVGNAVEVAAMEGNLSIQFMGRSLTLAAGNSVTLTEPAAAQGGGGGGMGGGTKGVLIGLTVAIGATIGTLIKVNNTPSSPTNP